MASVQLNGRLLDRDAERQGLERAWVAARRGQPQLVVVWGRRRVGKTFLLSHFIQKKRAVFFGATQQAEGVELGRLAEAVRRDLGDRVADLAGGAFATWEAALRFFAALAALRGLRRLSSPSGGVGPGSLDRPQPRAPRRSCRR